MGTHVRKIILALALIVLSVASAFADTATDYQQGIDLYNSGDYAKAAKVFSTIAASDADYAARAYNQLGLCLWQQKLLDDAFTAFANAIKSIKLPQDKNTLTDINYNYAKIYLEAGYFSQSVELVKQLLVNSPEKARELIVDYYFNKGDYEKALAATIYISVSANGIKGVDMQDIPVWLFSEEGKDEATAYVNSFSDYVLQKKEFTASPRTTGDIVGLLEQTERVDAAVEICRRGLSPNDTNEQRAKKILDIANIYYRTDNYSKAVETLSENTVSLRSSSTSLDTSKAFVLGQCYWKLNDIEAAKKLMNEIVDSKPGSDIAKKAEQFLGMWAKGSGE